MSLLLPATFSSERFARTFATTLVDGAVGGLSSSDRDLFVSDHPALFVCWILRKPLVWSPRGALQRWPGTTARGQSQSGKNCVTLCVTRDGWYCMSPAKGKDRELAAHSSDASESNSQRDQPSRRNGVAASATAITSALSRPSASDQRNREPAASPGPS